MSAEDPFLAGAGRCTARWPPLCARTSRGGRGVTAGSPSRAARRRAEVLPPCESARRLDVRAAKPAKVLRDRRPPARRGRLAEPLFPDETSANEKMAVFPRLRRVPGHVADGDARGDRGALRGAWGPGGRGCRPHRRATTGRRRRRIIGGRWALSPSDGVVRRVGRLRQRAPPALLRRLRGPRRVEGMEWAPRTAETYRENRARARGRSRTCDAAAAARAASSDGRRPRRARQGPDGREPEPGEDPERDTAESVHRKTSSVNRGIVRFDAVSAAASDPPPAPPERARPRAVRHDRDEDHREWRLPSTSAPGRRRRQVASLRVALSVDESAIAPRLQVQRDNCGAAPSTARRKKRAAFQRFELQEQERQGQRRGPLRDPITREAWAAEAAGERAEADASGVASRHAHRMGEAQFATTTDRTATRRAAPR